MSAPFKQAFTEKHHLPAAQHNACELRIETSPISSGHGKPPTKPSTAIPSTAIPSTTYPTPPTTTNPEQPQGPHMHTAQLPSPECDSLAHDIPPELAPRIKAAAARAGMRYESFTQQLLSCAFAHVTFWQQSDVERLFWLADRLGLDPLERDLIALEQKEPFPPSVAFMITLDGWVKLLHRHPRFRGLSFEEGPTDEHGMPLWVACSVFWEGFACPWVVREWASEHRSLHESWLNHPRRMLRHKALTQCARLALGIGGGFWAASAELEGSLSAQTQAFAPSHHDVQKSPNTPADPITQRQAFKPSPPLKDGVTKRPTTTEALKSAFAVQMAP